MYSTKLLKLLLVALSVSSAAQAMMIDAKQAAAMDIARRQKTSGTSGSSGSSDSNGALSIGAASSSGAAPAASSTSADSAASSTSAPAPSSTANTPTSSAAPPTSSSSPPSSSTSPPPTSSQAPPASSSTSAGDHPTTTPIQATSTQQQGGKTTTPPATTDSNNNTPLPVETSTYVVTSTLANGQQTSYTTSALTTPTASLSGQGSGNSSDKGMSTQTRNTIIGVVVGVGGAIVLAVIGLVAWRIWGRRRPSDDNDGLMAFGGVGTALGAGTEKGLEPGGTASTARSPFQSTLESYHAPAQVNQAANF